MSRPILRKQVNPPNSNLDRNLKYREQNDSDDDSDIIATFTKTKNGEVAEINEDYVLLGNSNIHDSINFNNGFYAVNSSFDANAAYYSESTITWKLGTYPTNLNGSKTYSIKVGDIMTPAILTKYLDAGLIMFKVNDLRVDIVPVQFLDSTMGTSTFKIRQLDYFNTSVDKIYEQFNIELNENVTGFTFEISTEGLNDSQILASEIAEANYKWYGARFTPNATPIEGSNIQLTMLVSIAMQPIYSQINDFRAKKQMRESHSLPSKFNQ